MTHARQNPQPPDPGRRRPRLRHWFKPRGPRTLVLGICAAVGGLAGAVRGVTDGAGAPTVLGLFAIGGLGVLLSVAYLVTYAKEHEGR